jgi:MSHA biogenesis protein MshG
MPVDFDYKARDREGNAVSGTVRFDTIEAARDFLDERELIPISVTARRRSALRRTLDVFRRRRVSEDLILFTRKLHALYKAGVPITNALGILAEQETDSLMGEVADQLRTDLERGYSLSEALEEHLDIFSDTFVSAIRIAENSGRLDVVLDKLATTMERDLETREQIKTAVRYPILVVFTVIVAFFVLVTFVVPKFAEFYARNSAKLPLPTQILIQLNAFISHYWPLLLFLIVVAIPTAVKLTRLQSVRDRLDRLILKLPVFGALFNKIYISRFAHLLGVTFTSGAPLLEGLETVRDAIGNRIVAAEVENMRLQIRQGNGLNKIRHLLPHFPHLALSLMQVGLESGSLDFMLQQVANFFDREIDYTTRRLMSLIEPFLILFLGAVVLGLALAIFLPMWNLIQVFRT